jgi:hypothetical protein
MRMQSEAHALSDERRLCAEEPRQQMAVFFLMVEKSRDTIFTLSLIKITYL